MGMSVGTTYRGNTLGSVWALLQGLDAEHCRDPPPWPPLSTIGMLGACIPRPQV